MKRGVSIITKSFSLETKMMKIKKDKKNTGNSVDALTIGRLLRHLLFKVVKEESDFKKIKKLTLDTG